jgi:hypothetical protein
MHNTPMHLQRNGQTKETNQNWNKKGKLEARWTKQTVDDCVDAVRNRKTQLFGERRLDANQTACTRQNRTTMGADAHAAALRRVCMDST